MTMSRELFKPPGVQNPGAAVSLADRALGGLESSRSGLTLVVFKRVLAGLCAVQGLLQWSAILLPSESLFDNLPPLQGAAVIYFAIFDLVAAVGLWLATPWGGVIWLFAALPKSPPLLCFPGSFQYFRRPLIVP
jgi:hypothetical protein